jgi:hypothetical protein
VRALPSTRAHCHRSRSDQLQLGRQGSRQCQPPKVERGHGGVATPIVSPTIYVSAGRPTSTRHPRGCLRTGALRSAP